MSDKSISGVQSGQAPAHGIGAAHAPTLAQRMGARETQGCRDRDRTAQEAIPQLPAPDPSLGLAPEDEFQIIEPVGFDFGLRRRTFVQLVASGLMIAVAPLAVDAQERGERRGGRGGGGGTRNLWERIHIGKDGVVTLLAGKVEIGQGSRAEYSQAAAEELRLPAEAIQVVMSDTALTPNDGNTAGSGSTPRTLPAIRQAAAAAREALLELAAKRWGVERGALTLRDGRIAHGATNRTLTFAELAQSAELSQAFEQSPSPSAELTPPVDWKVLGTSVARPNAKQVVTGAHRYPSDITRPGLLRGAVLRAPAYGAKLLAIDLAPAREMKDVTVVQDGAFIGMAAPTSFQARAAVAAIAKTAKWETAPHPSSQELYDYLRNHVPGGVPANPFNEEIAAAKKSLRATYHTAYIQHAPMETRAAVAEWKAGELTVWSGTQNPFGYRGELARAFRLPEEKVRVIVPDTGGGFGGKHTGEVAVEAARLAQAAGQPVALKWTRQEEFTWAYFRPAAVIDAEASLDDSGKLTSWHFININSGGSAVDSPYRIAKSRARTVNSAPPLRHGSYRALAATANNFARECLMDELAVAAGADPLDFRLAHLEAGRLRDVLEAAAKQFGWKERVRKKAPDVGVGLACGTEKGSYVAACVEVFIDRKLRKIVPRHVCEVFECGAIINPDNLRAQTEGAIIMGLGAALREGMEFEGGRLQNASFSVYAVPRFADVPELDLHFLNRKDLPAVGAGETPIIAIAPAISNAVFQSLGLRLRALPMVLPDKLPS